MYEKTSFELFSSEQLLVYLATFSWKWKHDSLIQFLSHKNYFPKTHILGYSNITSSVLHSLLYNCYYILTSSGDVNGDFGVLLELSFIVSNKS